VCLKVVYSFPSKANRDDFIQNTQYCDFMATVFPIAPRIAFQTSHVTIPARLYMADEKKNNLDSVLLEI
jgi:hypothetical protein